MPSLFLNTVLFAATVALAAPARAQDELAQPVRSQPGVSVPFDQWVAAGKREGIPWDVRVSPPQLGFDQRLELGLLVEVPGKALAKLGEEHELYLMTRIGDAHGHWIEQGWLGNKVSRALPKQAAVQFRMSFFVLPGEYTVAVVLYDHTTKLFSVHKQRVKAKPLKDDPLPHAFSSLPRVQMLPTANGIDALRNARVQSRLALAVQTERPVHFEVVLVLGPMEQRGLKSGSPYTSFGFAVTALHVLTQLRTRDSSFHLTVVDPLRRQVVMQQPPANDFDWETLKSSVSAINPGVISADALEGGRENLLFLRDLFRQRLSEPLPPVAGKKPLRVMLLIGSPMLLPRGAERAPLQAEAVGDALLFQFRFASFELYRESLRGARRAPLPRVNLPVVAAYAFQSDDLDAVLKAAKPTQFNIVTPEHFREALAHVIRSIETYGQAATTASGARSPL